MGKKAPPLERSGSSFDEDLGKAKKKNAVSAGIGAADDIKPPFLTRFIFQIVLGCMAGMMFMGAVLIMVGSYFNTTASEGMGQWLVVIGAACFFVGALGLFGCFKRVMAAMLLAELLLVALFIALYIAAIIAFMMASGSTNPIDKGVDTAWDNGLRRDVFEKDADRWCKKHTNLLGPCKIFYEKATRVRKLSSQAGDSSCNMTVTEMALDCQRGHEMCGRTSALLTPCTECDSECRAKVKDVVKEALSPAITVNFVLFGTIVVVIIVLNYLLEQPLKTGSQMQLAYVLNGIIGAVSFVSMLLMGVLLGKADQECPANQDCTSLVVLSAFLIIISLAGISVLCIVGLYTDNNLFIRIAALLYVFFDFMLLLVAIILAMANGTITDMGTYYNENWPDIRADLNEVGFCNFKSDGGALDPVGDDGEFVRPLAPDPNTDLCKVKMEQETEEAAVFLFSWAMLVIIGMASTIYFNLRGIKQLSMLGDYQERIMGEVTEARAAMMMEQAKVLAERNALEAKIQMEKAKLEARMAELGGDDAEKKQDLRKKKDKLDKKSKKFANPLNQEME